MAARAAVQIHHGSQTLLCAILFLKLSETDRVKGELTRGQTIVRGTCADNSLSHSWIFCGKRKFGRNRSSLKKQNTQESQGEKQKSSKCSTHRVVSPPTM